MTHDKVQWRLVVTVCPFGFNVRTETLNTTGDWNVLSETATKTFPALAVGRVADRDDYRIHIRF